MKRLAVFVLVVVFLFLLPLASTSLPTVAVLYFDNNSLMNKEQYDGLKKGLCDIMITELSKMSGLKVIEREELEKVMAEIALGQSGVVDESTAPKVGKLLGAQMLMLGSFMADMSGKIRIDTRLVTVETGEVMKAEEASGSAKNLFKLTKMLTFKLAEQLDIEVSKDEKKAIASSDRVSAEVLLVYSRGLELLDQGDKAGALGAFEEALAMDRCFTRAAGQIKRLKEDE